MKKLNLFILVFATLFTFLSLAAKAEADYEPVVTKWIDLSGKPKPLHEVFKTKEPLNLKLTSGIFSLQSKLGSQAGGRICIVTHTNIYSVLPGKINQYVSDLQADGYSVISYTYESGSAEDLRAYISNLYYEAESLVGTILIGEIPYIIYELEQNFDNFVNGYEDFPCDLFFMDLNGGWYDYSNSPPYSTGKYDTRSGNVELEIWASRMKVDTLISLGSESEILENYFEKNHNYRTGVFSSTNRALVYNDDDWAYMGEDDSNDVSDVYLNGDVVCNTNWNDTTTTDYINNQLPSVYDFIFVRSHGGPTSHSFESGGSSYYVYYTDYLTKNPPAIFYSLYICSGNDYTTTNYIGGITPFNNNSTGLVSFGSTKIGGMWKASKFYDSLAAGESIGEAFRLWFNYVQNYYSHFVDDKTPRWWYGMTIAGDAALAMRVPETLYVSLDGGHASPFDTWSGAATNIETALSYAGAGSVIIVSNGVFQIQNKLSINENNIILKSLNGRDETVIDGGFPGKTNVCVEFNKDNIRLEGFTITGGAGLSYPDNKGGGIKTHYTADDCSVIDCIISGNQAVYGGGIGCIGPVENCVISNNFSSSVGGGIYCADNGFLENCLIADNYADGSGGGIYFNDSVGTKNCIISNNFSSSAGGGIFLGQRCQIENSIICNNFAPDGGGVRTWVECDLRSSLIYGNTATNGGGIYCRGEGTIENCTITDNYATNFGGGLYCENNRDETNRIINNIIYYNDAGNNPNFVNSSTTFAIFYTHNCTFPEINGYVDGGGNITNKPNFVNALLNNYHIQLPSDCINSGTNLSWMATADDLDGNPRINGVVDLGCYELIPEPVGILWIFGIMELWIVRRIRRA